MGIQEYNGGSVLAMKGRNCVAIASDKRLGVEFNLIAKDRVKTYQVTPKVVVGLCGLATDCDTVYEKIRYRAKMYELREERFPSPHAMNAIISNLLYERRFGPYFVDPVVAGLDEHNVPFVSGMDLIGADCVSTFAVAGTSAEYMFAMAEAWYKPDLSPEELVTIVRSTFMGAVDRDARAGYGLVITLVTPEGVTVHNFEGRTD